MNSEIRDAFWQALAGSPVMMVRLAAQGSTAHPMTAQLDRDADGCFWFFMNRDNTLAAGGAAHADLSASGHTVFAAVEGTLTEETDRAVFDKLFTGDVAAWFKDGRNSPEILLMRFDLGDAEIWKIDTTIAGLFHRLIGAPVRPGEAGKHDKGPLT
ncbi:MAG: pyridoxamine 5'-phosphate oxidase family protein [Novosphingobium sp.]